MSSFRVFFCSLPRRFRWKNAYVLDRELCEFGDVSPYGNSRLASIVAGEFIFRTPSWMDIFTSTGRYRCAWIAFRDATSSIMQLSLFSCISLFFSFHFPLFLFFFLFSFLGTLSNFELVLNVLFRDSPCININLGKETAYAKKCLIWQGS